MADQMRILKNSSTVNCENGFRASSKSNKPLLEKKRRARINKSLEQLKALLMETIRNDASAGYSKLEKADILELAVKYLKKIQMQQHTAGGVVAEPDLRMKYFTGFKECAREADRYLSSMETMDIEVRLRLMNHLAGCLTVPPPPGTNYPPSIVEQAGSNLNPESRLHMNGPYSRLYNHRVHGNQSQSNHFQNHPYFPAGFNHPTTSATRRNILSGNSSNAQAYRMKATPEMEAAALSRDEFRVQNFDSSSLPKAASGREGRISVEENSQSMWLPVASLMSNFQHEIPSNKTQAIKKENIDVSPRQEFNRRDNLKSIKPVVLGQKKSDSFRPLTELNLNLHDSDFYDDDHDNRANESGRFSLEENTSGLLKVGNKSNEEDSFSLKDDENMWRPW